MKNAIKWIVGSLLIAALLWGARSIVRINQAALGEDGQATRFYGH